MTSITKPLNFLTIWVTLWNVSLGDVEFYQSQALRGSTVGKFRGDKHFQNVKNESNRDNIKPESRWRHYNTHEKENIETKKKRAIDPVFHGHPKTREELWIDHFLNETTAFDQTPSLIKLIHNLTLTYLSDCTPILLYDSQIKSKESYLFQDLLRNFPVTFVHGYINDNSTLAEPKLATPVHECVHFILFLTDVKRSSKVLGKQADSKVVVVARSSQWAVQEFLAESSSRMFINLLVIAQSFKEEDDVTLETPYILYTHKLYTDGLGASQPVVLNSWTHGKFSREVNLFPLKMTEGYAGHRFVIAAANQPPFVIRRVQSDDDGGNPRITWDGIEIRLLRLLAERNNFSIEILEPKDLHLGPGDAVANEISTGRADIGVAGMYMTTERIREMDVTLAHSYDCAAFVTLMSTALPRYRAILGPFHWHVWVALTFTYLFAIFPLAFSDKHTLRHLLEDSGEVENMFWYVFGTFTNCFTFVGKNSWSKTTKITTRLLIVTNLKRHLITRGLATTSGKELASQFKEGMPPAFLAPFREVKTSQVYSIGWYWLFTIIITSCYTGSIIAFVTLPVFPETVDTIQQLLKGFYRVGTLDRGGWERWFFNSSDHKTNKLLKKLELVPNVAAGIRNTTKAFFWPYAFLGSRAELEFIVQANFTVTKSKRAMLHVSNECFVPFGVIMGFPNNSLYTAKLSGDIQRMMQTGIIDKIVDEVRWEIQRSSTGSLLSVVKGSLKTTAVEEKGLTLEDTQGMFLLLAAGFVLAGTALLSEWMGGFTRRCRRNKKKVQSTSSANSREHLIIPNSNEIKITYDDTDSKLRFDTNCTSADSVDRYGGQIIKLTEENITVHTNSDPGESRSSNRSSSVELDREVREIFERDEARRRIVMDEQLEITDYDYDKNADDTNCNDAFGNQVQKYN